MSDFSCPFVRPFDGIDVSLILEDMTLWVGADETLKILRLPSHALHSLPECERTTLRRLQPCVESNKIYVTLLGVGILISRLVNRGCVVNDCATNEYNLPERANAFGNIFLTDVVSEIRIARLLCSISAREDDVLNLLNKTAPPAAVA